MKRQIKYVLLAIFLFFIFTLSACNNNGGRFFKESSENLFKIAPPKLQSSVNGSWKKSQSIIINNERKDQINQADEYDEIFISPSVFEFSKVKIFNPSVSARYVKLRGYLRSIEVEMLENSEIDIEQDVIVYKFQDNNTLSQDLIQTEDGKLLSFHRDYLNVYTKKADISADQEKDRFDKVKGTIEGTLTPQKNRDFAISIGLRKNKYKETGDSLSYDYKTLFLNRSNKDKVTGAMTVKDLVFYKDSVLWSVEHNRVIDPNTGLRSDRISANPTFRSFDKKMNFLQNNRLRRIDYVNDNYIAMTWKNELSEDNYDSYDIHNLNELSKDSPLTITKIGGVEAYENFKSIYNQNIKIMGDRNDEVISHNMVEKNIGIKRGRMSWDFISNIEAKSKFKNRTLYSSFSLQFIPIIDIGKFDNKDISIENVNSRVNGMISADVSPDGQFIMIQSENEISIYSLYNNFISVTPNITVRIDNPSEVVMVKWYPVEEIEPVKDDYSKLDSKQRLNTEIINQTNFPSK